MDGELTFEEARALAEGLHSSPFSVLGPIRSPGTPGVRIRTLQPHAERVDWVHVGTGERRPMTRLFGGPVFEIRLDGASPEPYRFNVWEGPTHRVARQDPYRFPLPITDFDEYLFGEGTHYRTYERMGAHPVTLENVEGTHFAVWAPNAQRVSVVGTFNRWDGRMHPMQSRGGSGLWEIFLPGVRDGELYKYEIRSAHSEVFLKADPYGFGAEMRPRSASRVCDIRSFAWTDGDWMERRRKTDWLRAPVSVYEVHAGSWRRRDGHWLTYRDLARDLVPYVRDLGFTHIEFLPITEHPYDASWGYQTTGFFAPTSRFGTPEDFAALVDACHAAGLGVILDWVPAHFPRDPHGLARFDGTHLYEHADPRQGEHRDWGTLIFNYGRREVRSFLLSSAVFWAAVYHVDGIRVDAVASMLYLDYSRPEGEWIPNRYGGRENLEAVDFLRSFNRVLHTEFPGILTFAEESTAWPGVTRPDGEGGLGFDFKWNMGWMHDILEYFRHEPVHRKHHHHHLTFSMLYAFSEQFILPFSHDEVVHGKRSLLDKMPGDRWQKLANLRLLFAFLAAHPGKKLLFMGQEFGHWREWDCLSELDWALADEPAHGGARLLLRDLNRLIASEAALHEEDFRWEGFEWLDLHDADASVLSFQRKTTRPREALICAFNFTPVPRPSFRLGVNSEGAYRELINTDASCYGGGNLGNAGRVDTEPVSWNGKPFSLRCMLPPLGAVFFRKE